ncbi:MAG: phage holin family protein [Burkholderiales bacterium]
MLASVRELARSLLAIVETRARLAATELEEQAVRLVEIALWFALAMLFLGVALVFLSVIVLLAFWDSNRMFAAGLLAVLYLGAGGACALVARARSRERPPLLSATVGELGKDLEHLDRKS